MKKDRSAPLIRKKNEKPRHDQVERVFKASKGKRRRAGRRGPRKDPEGSATSPRGSANNLKKTGYLHVHADLAHPVPYDLNGPRPGPMQDRELRATLSSKESSKERSRLSGGGPRRIHRRLTTGFGKSKGRGIAPIRSEPDFQHRDKRKRQTALSCTQ